MKNTHNTPTLTQPLPSYLCFSCHLCPYKYVSFWRRDVCLGLVSPECETETKVPMQVFYWGMWFQGAKAKGEGAKQTRLNDGTSHSWVQLRTIWGAISNSEERKKHFSMASQPPLVKGFPHGALTLPHFWTALASVLSGLPLSPANDVNGKAPRWEAREMGHWSGCTCEKLTGVDPELVTPTVPRLRDRWGQEDLKGCPIQSLWCTCNFLTGFFTEHYIFSILINISHIF